MLNCVLGLDWFWKIWFVSRESWGNIIESGFNKLLVSLFT